MVNKLGHDIAMRFETQPQRRLRWFATKEQNIMRISSPLMRRFQIPIALAGSMNDMLRSLFLVLAYHVLWKPVDARYLTALFPGAFSNAALLGSAKHVPRHESDALEGSFQAACMWPCHSPNIASATHPSGDFVGIVTDLPDIMGPCYYLSLIHI